MLATVKPKPKHVSSNSCSRRSNSPEISSNLATPAVKRSVSAHRRRSNSPDLSLKPNNAGAGEVSAGSNLLVTSTRSLSVSFQGASFSLQTVKKTKIPPQLPNLTRKRTPTPLRGKIDHIANTQPMDQYRWPGTIRQENVHLFSKRLNLDSLNSVNLLNPDGNSVNLLNPDGNSVNLSNPDGNSGKDSYSDTDRVSSGSSTSGIQENGSTRLQNGSKRIISTIYSETHSVLSFAVDVRRGKVSENRFFDAHLLRILYNRQLQWRFVNGKTEDMILKQKCSVEENLWNTWITISDLRDSVTKKRNRLQLLRQKLKLASVLKAQIVFLEDWSYLDKNHSISLLGAIGALKASTLRLPVGAGATADLQSMKDAINSALDVLQAMFSSTHSLCLQVEEVNLMATELAKVSAKERVLLRICKDFLTVLSALKVKECSLKTHMVQTSRAT